MNGKHQLLYIVHVQDVKSWLTT